MSVTGGAICSTAGEIAPPVNMLDEALEVSVGGVTDGTDTNLSLF